jgi:hypothetical protein
MPRQGRPADPHPPAKRGDPPGEDAMVITPAGPVRKGDVQPVGPNEVVRRNQDGTYTVVPRTDRRAPEDPVAAGAEPPPPPRA